MQVDEHIASDGALPCRRHSHGWPLQYTRCANLLNKLAALPCDDRPCYMHVIQNAWTSCIISIIIMCYTEKARNAWHRRGTLLLLCVDRQCAAKAAIITPAAQNTFMPPHHPFPPPSLCRGCYIRDAFTQSSSSAISC